MWVGRRVWVGATVVGLLYCLCEGAAEAEAAQGRANSIGLTPPSKLCGRKSMYSFRDAVASARAWLTFSNAVTFNDSPHRRHWNLSA